MRSRHPLVAPVCRPVPGRIRQHLLKRRADALPYAGEQREGGALQALVMPGGRICRHNTRCNASCEGVVVRAPATMDGRKQQEHCLVANGTPKQKRGYTAFPCILLKILERETGFEPATFSLGSYWKYIVPIFTDCYNCLLTKYFSK